MSSVQVCVKDHQRSINQAKVLISYLQCDNGVPSGLSAQGVSTGSHVVPRCLTCTMHVECPDFDLSKCLGFQYCSLQEIQNF